MGLADFFRRKMGHGRASKAADEWWAALRRGVTVEVPFEHSTDDLTTQSILILRERHPDVVVTMLQSRSLVLTVGQRATRVGNDAWNILDQYGYFPGKMSPDGFMATHAAFQVRNDVDPEVAASKAREEDRARNAVTVTSYGEAEGALHAAAAAAMVDEHPVGGDVGGDVAPVAAQTVTVEQPE